MSHSFEAIKAKLFTSVLSDTLAAAGYRQQAMGPCIRPLAKVFARRGIL
jgi:hypothetical protein